MVRALRRGVAWLVLAGFVSAQAAVWVAAKHDALEDDAACALTDGQPFVGPHHQAGLQFEEPNLPNPIEHCAICHLQRAVSNARLVRVSAITSPPKLLTAPVDVDRFVALVARPAYPSRGPPPSLS